jgi:methylmalonyl-CoA carboxyltransferase large subunit
MNSAVDIDLEALVAELRDQVSALSARLARIEQPAPPAHKPEPESISEEELAAISAAVAAYLGVRAHIRQVRLIGSKAWAQEGRVSIQASHRLHY